jgi:type II secretory pathway component GspD/PulD (secretin)
MKLFVVALALFVGLAVARADDVEVIALRYRTSEQVIPTLRPMVEPGGAISGMQSTLVIRASRANIAQLKQIVAALDTLPRRLLISVRQDGAGMAEARGAGVSGTLGGGDVRVGINEPARRQSGITVGIVDSRGSTTDNVSSQVQALEGSPALIMSGQSVPVRNTVVTPGPGGSMVQSTTSFQNLNSGFYVTPRVSGERVFLDIAPQRVTPGRHGPGSAEVQQIVTTASGRLGEWFPLGGVDQSAAASRSGVLSGATGSRNETSSVWVKVDEIK